MSVIGFSTNRIRIKVVFLTGKGLKRSHASSETLQRIKLLVVDISQEGFHIVVLHAITYFTIGA